MTMTLGKVWDALDAILRVPPLLMMDAILNTGLGMTNLQDTPQSFNSTTVTSDPTDSPNDAYAIPAEITKQFIMWLFIYATAFMAAFLVFLLTTKQLLTLYLWLASLGVVIWSYIWNEEYIKYAALLADDQSSVVYELTNLNPSALAKFGGNYFVQMFLAMIFCFSNNFTKATPRKRAVGFSFIGPTVISLLPLPTAVLLFTPIAAGGIALLFICFTLVSYGPAIFHTIHISLQWCRNVVQHYGFYTLFENQWSRLQVPRVLRVFWLMRALEQVVFLLAESGREESVLYGAIAMTLNTFYAISKQILVRGCETVVAVFGMSSIISSIAYYIGFAVQKFLLVEDPEDRTVGTVSAILFLILALQTGLTGMEPEKRFLRLYRNICLLFTAILHFIHNMVNPVLLSLGASQNTSLNKHGRALIVCAFLLIFPSWFLVHLWNKHSLSTWLLAVSAFSIEVVIKVITSLLVYILFMRDAYRTAFWEELDDYVYYIRATGNTIEFIFGIFLFFNGAWILLFESGGTIRACMMCIHAYFNIWLQANLGWKTFVKRRLAVTKISSLPEATEEQLRNFDDVCAICYQELNSARITRCNHYFHAVCLRKWLYVQDICPLCHEVLYQELRENRQDDQHERQD